MGEKESIPDLMLKNSEHSLLIREVELLLSEKRTSLSALRTGIAVIALPISVVSFLIATSRLYEIQQVLYLIGPLLGICTILTALGIYLITRAIIRIRKYDEKIESFKKRDEIIRDLMDIGD